MLKMFYSNKFAVKLNRIKKQIFDNNKYSKSNAFSTGTSSY